MKTIIQIVIAVLGLGEFAWGAPWAGKYRIIDAHIPKEGSSYSGSVVFEQLQAAIKISWKLPWWYRFYGIGLEIDDTLFASYGSDSDALYAIGVYRFSEGQWRGKFISTASTNNAMDETWSGPFELRGTYGVRGAPGQALTIEPNGQSFSVTRASSGKSYPGVAMKLEDYFVVAWGDGADLGVVAYQGREGLIRGTWAHTNLDELGWEVLKRE